MGKQLLCTDVVGYLCFGYKNIDKNGTVTFEKNSICKEGICPNFYRAFLYGNPMHPNCCLYYYKTFDYIGYFNEHIKYYNDWEFFRRSYINKLKWYYIPITLVVYNQHEDNRLSNDRDSDSNKVHLVKMFTVGCGYLPESDWYDSAKHIFK